MWTYLKENDLQNFLNENPELSEYIESICLLKTKNELFLPRLMYKNYNSKYLHYHEGKKDINPEGVKFKFNGELRDKQKPITGEVLERFHNENCINGIIKLPPGFGKTVLSIYLAYKIGLKTCIIVDNSDLMKQWIKEIIKFTNLTEDDIGIIKQKLFVTDKPITIAMSQSLLSKLRNNFHKTFHSFDDSKFGLIIYDEVHRTSASQEFAKVSVIIRSKNIIGLSATPFQTGVAEVLMKNTIGPVIYESAEYDKTPTYYLYYYKSGLNQKYKYINRINDFIKQRGAYNRILPKSENYLNTVVYFTRKLKEKGYIISVLCMTKDQINTISEALSNNGIDHRRYYGDEREIDKENDQVLVMTYKFAGTGFDMKSLSAMILACPLSGKKSLIQSIGRILRNDDGKNDPVVIDLIDKSFSFIFTKEIKRKISILKNEFGGNNIKIHEIDEDNYQKQQK